MFMYTDLHQFYVSGPWRDLCYSLKTQRLNKCERCGAYITDKKYLIGHHKTTLTLDNVNDPNISLNPDQIEIICHKCHNKEHRRFGYTKQVYIVWGSPRSGKTTAVMQMVQHGDIIMDIDALWMAVTMQPEFIKPNNCRFNIFKLKDDLLDQIKTRYGQWNDAYIIGGYPNKYERERIAQELGAKLIYCDSTYNECIKRAASAPPEYADYITKWWDEYNRCGA